MKNRRGAILIVVLVIVMMISLAAYHFTMAMESEHLATRNAGDQISSRHCALSGIELVAAILQQPRSDRNRLDLIANVPIDLWPTESENGSPYRTIVSFPSSSPIRGSLGLDTPGDESSKLNLHRLLDWDQDSPGLAREALLRLPEMDESTADRLLDWIDNSVPLVVDQLGFLHRERLNRQAGAGIGDKGKSLRPAWLDYLTVDSAERNESFDGRRRIFINDSDLPVLHRQLSERLSYRIANYIVLYRQYGPIDQDGTINKDGTVGGPTTGSTDEQVDLSIPAKVRISSLASLIDSAVQIPDLDQNGSEQDQKSEPQIIASPISLDVATAGNQPIGEILDAITTTQEARLVGRVNALTAPAAVLAAVPGLSEELAQKIVSGRDSSDRRFRHPIGLLSSLSLDSTIVGDVLPHLTIAGDVLVAEVTGSLHFETLNTRRVGPPSYRCEVILDASEGPTKYAVFRQLSPSAASIDTQSDPTLSPTSESPQTKRSGAL